MTFQEIFQEWGNPVLVTAWDNDAPAVERIADLLIHSTDQDALALGCTCAPGSSAIALYIWLMLHKECQLILEYGNGSAAHPVSRTSLLKAVEFARAEYEGKKTRP